jgi:hypothetical protein
VEAVTGFGDPHRPQDYEHLPTRVTAMPWLRDNRGDVLAWLAESGAAYRTSATDETELRISPVGPFDLVLGTPQGPRPVLLGDMVVAGVGRAWYPVGPKIWQPSYRLVGW